VGVSPASDLWSAAHCADAAERAAERAKGEHLRTQAAARTVKWVFAAAVVVVGAVCFALSR
jgi:hypothetical protein